MIGISTFLTSALAPFLAAGADTAQCAALVHEDMRIGEAAVHVVRPRDVPADAPIAVLYHGFGAPADAESLERVIAPLVGAVTVYPTLKLTGARMPAGGRDEVLRLQSEDYVARLLFPAIESAADELPAIVGALSRQWRIAEPRLAVFGFSAGGAASLMSLERTGLKPRAVAALNAPLSIRQAVANWERASGRAYIWSPEARAAAERYDVAAHAGRIARDHPDAAILLMQGDADEQFPVETARAAADALKRVYTGRKASGSVELTILRGGSHQLIPSAEPDAPGVAMRRWLAKALGISAAPGC